MRRAAVVLLCLMLASCLRLSRPLPPTRDPILSTFAIGISSIHAKFNGQIDAYNAWLVSDMPAASPPERIARYEQEYAALERLVSELGELPVPPEFKAGRDTYAQAIEFHMAALKLLCRYATDGDHSLLARANQASSKANQLHEQALQMLHDAATLRSQSETYADAPSTDQ